LRLNVPLIRRVWRRLRAGRHVRILSLATKESTFSPEATIEVPRALHLAGALEKIRKLSPYRSWEREMPLIEGGPLRLRASRACVVENVDIAGPCLYAGPATGKRGFGRERLVRTDALPVQHLERANLVTTWSGSHFFGTYFLDDLPLELIAESPENVALATQPYEHEAGYRELLGLVHPRVLSDARVEELVIYDEPPQSPHRAARYRTLRARLRAGMPSAPSVSGPGVFLRRGRSGERRVLENEPEIEAALERLGFEVVDPAGQSAEAIARSTLGAKIVVSVEGSQLSHAVYSMADEGAFLVLQPPDRFALQYKEFADPLGMRFAFAVGSRSSHGFTMSIDDLRATLDLLL
jgi:hypothetical protein